MPTCSYSSSRTCPARLSEAERAGYAREAAALLARIATDRKGPLAADLAAAEPALALALSEAETAPAAATALGEYPTLTPSAAWPTWCSTPPDHRYPKTSASELVQASGGSDA